MVVSSADGWVRVDDGWATYWWLPATGETAWSDPNSTEQPTGAVVGPSAGRLAAAQAAQVAVEKLSLPSTLQGQGGVQAAASVAESAVDDEYDEPEPLETTADDHWQASPPEPAGKAAAAKAPPSRRTA